MRARSENVPFAFVSVWRPKPPLPALPEMKTGRRAAGRPLSTSLPVRIAVLRFTSYRPRSVTDAVLGATAWSSYVAPPRGVTKVRQT
jgi:hypothetical protein